MQACKFWLGKCLNFKLLWTQKAFWEESSMILLHQYLGIFSKAIVREWMNTLNWADLWCDLIWLFLCLSRYYTKKKIKKKIIRVSPSCNFFFFLHSNKNIKMDIAAKMNVNKYEFRSRNTSSIFFILLLACHAMQFSKLL